MSVPDRAGDTTMDAPSAPSPAKRAAAVVVAWLVPGLGHVLLGRARRGLMFGAIVFGAFGLGLAHDGRLALRSTEHPVLTSLQVVANLGVGPADFAARVAVYGAPAYAVNPNSPRPRDQERLTVIRDRMRSGVSTYGTAYLWTAGIMNLLLLFDVWDVGRGRA